MLRPVRKVHGVESQTGRFRALVVTGHAVLIDEGVLRRALDCALPRTLSCALGRALGAPRLRGQHTGAEDETRKDCQTHVQILPYLWDDRNPMMKLVEEYAGVGDLTTKDESIPQVRYRIARYQGFVDHSGLPVPGVHRIEGSVDTEANLAPLIGQPLTLRLEDGRAIAITIADTSGRVLAEGHGPSRCLCC